LLKTSFYNKINHYNSKKLDFILITTLVVLTVFFSMSIYEKFNASSFTLDSVLFHNTVNNILRGNGMSTSVLYTEGKLINTENGIQVLIISDSGDLIENFPSIINPYLKSVLFFLLEAGFFKLVGANPLNWIFYGAFLSTLISLCFVILFYFLIKKNFDRGIAFFSSLGIISSWSIFLVLTTARTDVTMYTFLIAAFFFINKSTRHYIIFGILGSLGTLTHQSAAIFVYGYLAFLLYKKEFKGFLIVFFVYLALLTPVMIHQYSVTGDFGMNLGIPSFISLNLSSLIDNLTGSTTTIQNQLTQDLYFSDYVISTAPTPFEFIAEFFSYDLPNRNLHLHELYLFSSIFILAAFVSFVEIKKKINKKSILKSGLILSAVTFFILFINNLNRNSANSIELHVVELLIITIIPISIILLSLKNLRNSNIFRKPPTRFFSSFPFLIGFGFFGFYLASFSTGFLIFYVVQPLIFLLVPFGLYGFKRLVNLIPTKFVKNEHWISYLIIGLIVVPISYVTADENIPSFNSYYPKLSWVENEDTKNLHSWLLDNTDPNSVFMHEFPAVLSLYTGNPVAIIPSDFYDRPYEIPKYIDHFKIEYVVFYYPTIKDEQIMNLLQFEKVYNCPLRCAIFKNTINWENFNSYEYTKMQVDWAKTLMKLGKVQSAYKVYAEILDIKEFDEHTIVLILANKLAPIKNSQEYEKKANLIINSISFDLEAIKKYYKNDLELVRLKLEPIFSSINYDDIVSQETDNSKFFVGKKKLADFLQNFETFVTDEIQNKLQTAKDLENQKRYSEALHLYNEVAKIDEFNFQVYEGKIRIFKLLEDENSINKAYDEFYDQYQKKINNYKGFDVPVNNLLENRISLIYSEIDFWYEDDSFYKVLDAYEELLNLNRFSYNATLGKAQVLEKLDRLPEALSEYKSALRLVPEDQTDLRDKIDIKIRNLKIII